jgi:hypothetical protein
VVTIEKHYGHHAQDNLKEAANAVLAASTHKAPIFKKSPGQQFL